MEEAERLCDRVAIVDHGKVIAMDSPSELVASIGAGHLVEFPAADIPNALALGAIRAVEGVRDARAENGSVRVQVVDLQRVLPVLLEEVRRQGIPLTELRTHSATLEDVFVFLTGRHLRDE
jgi:ABC-2 type transport system ATP-binding protein